MMSLSACKLDDALYERLKLRAAQHGISMEEEVRRILQLALAAPERLGSLALKYFGNEGVEIELPPREPHEPITLA
jgi:antitoxin FitA